MEEKKEKIKIEINIKSIEGNSTKEPDKKLNENEGRGKGPDKDKNKNEKESVKNPITKYSSLSPDLFYLSYISEYKCKCGLIPSPETANEIICCGVLLCEKCLDEIILGKKAKECPFCKSSKINFRKIKDGNKIFYKTYINITLKCPYNCDWKGAYGDLGSHLNTCNKGTRYCKYKKIGCEFYGESKKVLEHEKNNDKLHLEMALKYIKKNNIIKRKLEFKIGETCRTSVHPHIMQYMTSISWSCDGKTLPHGCYSRISSFNAVTPRFRCSQCDFDLCDKCIVNYIIS